MTKIRPCKTGCGYPAVKGRQFCHWHALLRSSSDVQANAAQARLLGYTGEHRQRVPATEWPEGERWCAGCQSFVPLFYCNGSRCRACSSMASHARRLADNYGITPEEYARIFKLQGGRCAICRNRPASIRFAVDHDHKTGEVRGILCKRCNHDLLGGGHDDVVMLFRALEYLLFPPAQRRGLTPPQREVVLEALRVRLTVAEGLAAARRPDPSPPPF